MVTKKNVITDQFTRSLCSRLVANKHVRRKLPIYWRVDIDRQLPFFCVYRKPPNRNDAGTEKLLFGEAAYLTASGDKHLYSSLCLLVSNIAKTQAEVFDQILINEIWSSQNKAEVKA